LERSNAELEQFATVASHDLHEPLRSISGYLGILMDEYGSKLDAEGSEFLGYAREGAERLRQQLDALLHYARFGTRQRAANLVCCEKVLADTMQGLHSALEEAHAIVTYDPLPVVCGDAAQLTELFQNLIANALKFCTQDHPHIHISTRNEEGETVILFADNGIGIANHNLERIFVPFQRLHKRESYAGMGMGLAICKKIVERHGGRISVSSQPGKGSIFSCYFPTIAV
jgi:light-regulated signal transduction histidine kinase (bacteriophytochrome)